MRHDNDDLVWIIVLVLILIILYFVCNNRRNSSGNVSFDTFFNTT